MLNVRNLARISVAGIVAVAVIVLTGTDVSARPKYAKAATAKYPDLVKKHGTNGKLSCAVCHPVKSKKKRNNYGLALSKHLTKKNESDVDKITAALTKTEADKSATDGKTFGDLIKAGELPGTKKEAN
jgi:hypothetical protein